MNPKRDRLTKKSEKRGHSLFSAILKNRTYLFYLFVFEEIFQCFALTYHLQSEKETLLCRRYLHKCYFIGLTVCKRRLCLRIETDYLLLHKAVDCRRYLICRVYHLYLTIGLCHRQLSDYVFIYFCGVLHYLLISYSLLPSISAALSSADREGFLPAIISAISIIRSFADSCMMFVCVLSFVSSLNTL